MTSDTLVQYMTKTQNKYTKTTEQLSSGNRILVPSDDPLGTITVLNINSQLSQLNGYIDNISTAKNEINTLDSGLTSITTALQKANDLAIQAANGTNSSTSYSAIKQQIDQIIANVKDLGNTNYNGVYIFSGTKTSTTPFQDITTGGISYNGTPSTGAYQRTIPVSDGVNVTINTTGDSLLGSYDVATATGSGAFKALYELSTALGATPADTTTIKSCITQLQTSMDNVTATRTSFAALTNRLDMTSSYLNTNVTQLTSQKSDVYDTDVTTATTDMYSQKTALEASMSIASQVLQLGSLWDYMK